MGAGCVHDAHTKSHSPKHWTKMTYVRLSFMGYKKYKINKRGVIKSLKRKGWKRLVPYTNKHGYPTVGLSKHGTTKKFRVNRLVLLAFRGPCPEGMQCRHLNGIKDDNRIDNLKWGTPKRNQKDRIKHGTTYGGEDHHKAKLTEEIVLKIRKQSRPQERNGGVLARKYNVSISTIHLIVHHKIWRHV